MVCEGEDAYLQLRVEAFNLFNRANFANPSSNLVALLHSEELRLPASHAFFNLGFALSSRRAMKRVLVDYFRFSSRRIANDHDATHRNLH